MKNIYKSILYIAIAVVAASCAKYEGEGTNEAKKRYFDAWMSINYHDLKPQWDGKYVTGENATGIYVIHDVEGTGVTIEKEGFVLVDYTQYDLAGNITEFTDSTVAKQLGSYNPADYYGPTWLATYDEAIPSGLLNAMVGMKVGGSRKLIIPSWFMTYSSYSKPADYLKHSCDFTNSIYEFTIKDFCDTLDVWECDSIERYIVKNYGEVSAFANDTTGFYFRHKIECPEDIKEFPSDTTIYINYTGKLLNGLVFDTTIERVAKDNNIYDPTRDYTPVQIAWGAEHDEISMGADESSVIPGFSMTMFDLKYSPSDKKWNDKATGIFTSNLGYGYSGSGASIPPYASLIFEIEVVEVVED